MICQLTTKLLLDIFVVDGIQRLNCFREEYMESVLRMVNGLISAVNSINGMGLGALALITALLVILKK